MVLDSCFSGGFSKDMTWPGRMGLFTSEEDTVALVPEKFEAGGYLSEFFDEAIREWDADMNRDDAISAFELSDYIHERYRHDLRDGVKSVAFGSVPTMVLIEPHQQRFVVDRSGLRDPHRTIIRR